MTASPQLDLFAPTALPESADVEWFVAALRGRDWITAGDFLRECGLARANETQMRRLRAYAAASGGRIGSGDLGYKLIAEMTADEFGRFERRLASQEAEMKSRRVAAMRVFFGQTNVPVDLAG